MGKKRKLSFILAVILIISLLTACGGKQAQTKSQGQDEAKKIVFAEAQEWQGSDIYQVEYAGKMQFAHLDGVLTFDMDTKELVPNIATSFKISDDNKTIRLTIPEGLKYANGEPVLPEDLKRSIEWGLEVSPYSGDYAAVQSVEIDGNDVIIRCDGYSSTVIYYLTCEFMGIIDKQQIDNLTPEELLMDAVQYGLFYIDEIVAGSHATLNRNENYKTNNPNVENKGPAHFQELVVKFMPDGFSRVAGLKAGEIDVAFDIPTENVEELENDPNIKVIKNPRPGVVYLTLNKDNLLFEDINIRKAIAYAINRNEIATVNKGYVKPAYGFIVPEMMDYSSEITEYYENNYSNDLEKAKQLLADAGWADTDGDGYLDKNGKIFEFSLMANSEKSYSKNAIQVLQLRLKEIGIKANIGTAERGYLKEKLRSDDYDAIMMGFEWPEPASGLPYIIYDSNNIDNEKYYDRLLLAAATRDGDERISKFAEAQKILMDEVTFIPLIQDTIIVAHRNNITGIQFLSDGRIICNDIDKK